MSESARPHNPEMTVDRIKSEEAERLESQPLFDFEELRQTLVEHVETMQKQFKVKHRNLLRWAKKQGYTMHFLLDSASRLAVTGGLVGSLLAGAPQLIVDLPAPPTQEAAINQSVNQVGSVSETNRSKDQMSAVALRQKQVEAQEEAMRQLKAVSEQQLNQDQADMAATLLSELTGVSTTAELEGYRLNTNNGRIGAEQHLYRYPGDNLGEHFGSVEERRLHESSGFAPGLGAYGYFASSKAAMTPEIAEREKYYLAIQTFLSPNWSGNVNEAYNWFKYRKMIVYNPVTQKAVVAVVGDAGPALSTGKNYGGSPEVMNALGSYDGYGSPPVLTYFVEDDPKNPIPLGPVDFKLSLLE